MARRKSGLANVSRLRRKLRRLPAEATDEVRTEIADAAEFVKFEQLKRVPVDEGDLATSIEVKLGSDKLSASIGPGARTRKARKLAGWRAHFVEFGTKAHKVIARASRRDAQGRLLRAEGKGARVLSDSETTFGTAAAHPGIAARPFVYPALAQNIDAVTEMIAAGVDRALLRASRRGR